MEKNGEKLEYLGKDTTKISDVMNTELIIQKKKEKLMKEEVKETEKVERMGMDDSKVATRLLEKTFSPLLVRKYMIKGWNMYIAIIADPSLSDLDTLVYDTMDECEKAGMFQNDLQCMRNIVGYTTEKIVNHYNMIKRGSTEGVYVLWGFDKGWVASAYGDLMQHNKCVIELFGILGMAPHT